MNKRRIAVALLIVVMALVVSFIFGNSLKSREESKKDSDAVAGVIMSIIEAICGKRIDNIRSVVRKLAHLAEFCMLGLAVSGLLAVIDYSRRWWLCGYGLLFCLIIAVCDELIQSFVGRGSAVGDVLIDFAGAFLGFFALIAAIEVIKHIKNRKNIVKKEENQ